MKKFLCLILFLFNLSCGLDLVLSQASVAKTKKEEAQKADQQAQKIVEKMKQADEQSRKTAQEAIDKYNK